jgi:hypothetical protein
VLWSWWELELSHSQRLSEPHTSDDVNTQQQQQPALECVSVTCNEQLVTLEAWSEDAVRVTATPLGAPPPPAGYPSAMLPGPLQRLKGEEMRSRGEVRSSTRASNMHHVLCARTSTAMRMTASRPTSHSHGHARALGDGNSLTHCMLHMHHSAHPQSHSHLPSHAAELHEPAYFTCRRRLGQHASFD